MNEYDNPMAQDPTVLLGFMLIASIVSVVLFIVTSLGLMKLFSKAGKPGWAAFVPVYNYVILLEMIGRPVWWILFVFIPFVNVFVLIYMFIQLAKCFGKSTAYGILMVLFSFIMIPILGFSDAQYQKPKTLDAV